MKSILSGVWAPFCSNQIKPCSNPGVGSTVPLQGQTAGSTAQAKARPGHRERENPQRQELHGTRRKQSRQKSTGPGSDLNAALGFSTELGPVASRPYVPISSLFCFLCCLRASFLRSGAVLPYSQYSICHLQAWTVPSWGCLHPLSFWLSSWSMTTSLEKEVRGR